MANYHLPKKIQDQLANLPETGMGYQKCKLTFSDGKVIKDIYISNGKYFSTNENIDINKLIKIIIQKNKFMV